MLEGLPGQRSPISSNTRLLLTFHQVPFPRPCSSSVLSVSSVVTIWTAVVREVLVNDPVQMAM